MRQNLPASKGINAQAFSALVIIVSVLFSGCSAFGPPENSLAKVHGRYITTEDMYLKAGLYGLEIKTPDDAKSIVNGIISDRLVLARAAKDRVKISKAELKTEIDDFVPGYSDEEIRAIMKKSGISYDAWYSDIRDRALIKKEIDAVMKERIKITPEELRDYYWTNLLDFKSADRVRARQIVVTDIKKAYELLRRASNGEDFAALAKKYSTGSEAESGGDLGWFRKSEMPAFIANEAFRLKPGMISRIMQSPYGFHILKCEESQKARTPKFEEVSGEVYAACYAEKKQEIFEFWVKDLRQAARVEVYENNINRLFKEEKNEN